MNQQSDYRSGDIAHNVILEGRRQASVSGVLEVLSFDEQEVLMETSHGTLRVEGVELHVEKLSLDIGELRLQGEIDAVEYVEPPKKKGSLWSRIF